VRPAKASSYLKFGAIGVVMLFGAAVGGLWVTRAAPMADGPAPADPLKNRRASPSPGAVSPAVSDGPVETRSLITPEEMADSADNALAAQAVASATLRDNPDNVKALTNLGSALLKLHEPAKAFPVFAHAARLAPDQWQVQFSLARAQVQLGRWRDALLPLQSVKTMRPDDYVMAFNLALALHRTGNDERAIDEYRRAIALRREDGSLYRSLAISLQRSGRRAEAVQAYQDYLRLMPGAADAEQIKGRIAALQGPAAPRPAGAPSTTR
jgi:tetratricopeptide (TPR) repeat protein